MGHDCHLLLTQSHVFTNKGTLKLGHRVNWAPLFHLQPRIWPLSTVWPPKEHFSSIKRSHKIGNKFPYLWPWGVRVRPIEVAQLHIFRITDCWPPRLFLSQKMHLLFSEGIEVVIFSLCFDRCSKAVIDFHFANNSIRAIALYVVFLFLRWAARLSPRES